MRSKDESVPMQMTQVVLQISIHSQRNQVLTQTEQKGEFKIMSQRKATKAGAPSQATARAMSLKEKIEATGAKPIWPPKTLGKKFRRIADHDSTKSLLIAILYTPNEYLREITDGYTLRCVVNGVYSATFYALTPRRLQMFQQLLKRSSKQPGNLTEGEQPVV